MSKEFTKEDRYLVVKRSDIQRVLLNWEIDELYRLAEMVEKGRENLNKASLECVVVESDWPIYNDVWKMVGAIAKGEPTELEQLRKELEEVKRERDFLSDTIDQLSDHVTDAELQASSLSCKLDTKRVDTITQLVNSFDFGAYGNKDLNLVGDLEDWARKADECALLNHQSKV